MSGETKPYTQIGCLDFGDANEANIPVIIFLEKEKNDRDEETGMWLLTAKNFMPRDYAVSHWLEYRFVCKDRQILVDMVQRHWRPLYERALNKLKLEPDKDGEADVYYW